MKKDKGLLPRERGARIALVIAYSATMMTLGVAIFRVIWGI